MPQLPCRTMPFRSPRAPIPAVIASLLGFLLSSCFKDSPVVMPGNVYDAQTAIRPSRYVGMDSIHVLLVDADDTTRIILLWSGAPDSTRRLPVHVAAEGERFFFRVEGYREGRGLCFSETLRDGASMVGLDECIPEPAPVFADSMLRFGIEAASSPMAIRNPARFAGRLEIAPKQSWIKVSADTLWMDSAGPDFPFEVTVARGILAPGIHQGMVLLRDAGAVHDTLHILAESRSIDIFKQDTLRFGNETDSLDLPILLPQTDQPDWLGAPPVPWLAAALKTFPNRNPGDAAILTLQVDRAKSPAPKGSFSTVLYALDGMRRPMDSLVAVMSVEDWPGGVRGAVKEWSSMAAVPEAEVELLPEGVQADGTKVRADSNGRFAFTGLRAGNYRLVATGEARLGSVATVSVGVSDTSVDLRISPRYRVKAVETEGAAERIGSVTMVDGLAVVPRSALGGDGKLLAFSIFNIALRQYMPHGGTYSGAVPVPTRESAEAAGNSSQIFISYPSDSTLAIISSWKTASPEYEFRKVGFQPYGLLLDGENLVCAGQIAEDRIVVSRIRIADFSYGRQDTLQGAPRPDSRDSLASGPLIAYQDDHYFITEGNALRGTAGAGKVYVVTRSRPGPAAVPAWLAALEGACDVVSQDGSLYIAGGNSVRSGLKEGIFDAKPGATITTFHRNTRIAAGQFTTPKTYLAVTTQTDTVLVLSPDHGRPIGRLAIPEGRLGRSVAIHGSQGRILFGDSRKVYVAGPD